MVIEFDESGWEIVEDTRCANAIGGYLHIGQSDYGDFSAEAVTDKVRNNIIKYYFNHPRELPGIGATPQSQYMNGLSLEEREAIGNRGERAYYA